MSGSAGEQRRDSSVQGGPGRVTAGTGHSAYSIGYLELIVSKMDTAKLMVGEGVVQPKVKAMSCGNEHAGSHQQLQVLQLGEWV